MRFRVEETNLENRARQVQLSIQILFHSFIPITIISSQDSQTFVYHSPFFKVAI